MNYFNIKQVWYPRRWCWLLIFSKWYSLVLVLMMFVGQIDRLFDSELGHWSLPCVLRIATICIRSNNIFVKLLLVLLFCRWLFSRGRLLELLWRLFLDLFRPKILFRLIRVNVVDKHGVRTIDIIAKKTNHWLFLVCVDVWEELAWLGLVLLILPWSGWVSDQLSSSIIYLMAFSDWGSRDLAFRSSALVCPVLLTFFTGFLTEVVVPAMELRLLGWDEIVANRFWLRGKVIWLEDFVSLGRQIPYSFVFTKTGINGFFQQCLFVRLRLLRWHNDIDGEGDNRSFVRFTLQIDISIESID